MKHNIDRLFLILSLDFYLLITGIKRFTIYFYISVTVNFSILILLPDFEIWLDIENGISP